MLEDAAGSGDLFLLTEDGYSDRCCTVQYRVQCQGDDEQRGQATGRAEDTGSHAGNDHISLPLPCQTLILRGPGHNKSIIILDFMSMSLGHIYNILHEY